MKKVFLVLVSSIFFLNGYGQNKIIEAVEKNNTIAINMGSFKFFNVFGAAARGFPVKGITYQRMVNKNLGVRAGFSFWNSGKSIKTLASVHYLDLYDLENKPNDKWVSYKFNFYDLELVYRKKISRHNISFLAGPSFATYTNGYIENVSFVILANGTKHSLGIDTYVQDKSAIGFTFGTEYNYQFLENRLESGFYIKGRSYPNNVQFSLNYGIQVGFNF